MPRMILRTSNLSRLTLFLAVALACPLSAAPRSDDQPSDPWLDANTPDLVTLYKHLHAHPELSYHEIETAKRIAADLRQAGFDVTENVGNTGLVGVLRNGEGPTVLVRSDLDALPVTEETGLPYASQVTALDDEGDTVGVMHACGHDMHMTCLVGVARWLAEHRDTWRGTVVLIGQPAEEKVGGARSMLDDGLYKRFPKPDFALALHVAHDLEAGHVAYTSGPAMASSTAVDIVVNGKGGHGAGPHETVDPIVLASLLVLDLQSIVSREIKPTDPAVITVGSFHGGTKHNIIPASVELQLTLRAYSESVRQRLIEGIQRRAAGLAAAHKAPAPVVTIGETTPPTINDPALVARVVKRFNADLGTEKVREVEPVMGAEDFGLFNEGGVPIFMFRLGTIPPDRINQARSGGAPLPPVHSSRYAPDPEPSIRTGVRAMTGAVRELLAP